MAELWTIQSNLNRGEVDPTILGRTDLRSYYNGLEEAVNVVTQPQGGVKKRGGFTTVDGQFPFLGRMETFAFSEGDEYLVVFTVNRMYIYRDGVRQENINGTGQPFLRTTLSRSQLEGFNYIQTADTIILTGANLNPTIIQRASDTEWTIRGIRFTNIPQYQFNDALSPTPSTASQTIQFTGWRNGDRFRISLEGQLTDEIIFGGTLIGTVWQESATFQRDIRQALQNLSITGSEGITVAFRTNSAGYVVRVDFTGLSASNWGAMSVTPIFNTSNDPPITIVSIIPGGEGSSSAEPVWSATRGWPISATFHEGRLYFAGTTSLPNTIWGSRLGDFFNFGNRRNLDDEAIIATLDSDQVNTITAIYSNRTLQIFTTGAEFAVVTSGAITPSNFAVAPQSVLGSAPLRPISLEGTTLFIQRTGRALIQYVFINEFQAHQSNSVSLLASHLINDPQKIFVARGTAAVDANYVYLINEDGRVVVFNSLVAEELAGFSQFDIDGRVVSGAIINEQLHLLLFRNNAWVIVREEPTCHTDLGVMIDADGTGGTSTITGLMHLAGEEVAVRGDGAYLGQFTVGANGQIDLPDTYDQLEAGLLFSPRIRTLPLNVPLQNGPNAAAKKKIARCAVRVLDTTGVVVNDQLMLNRESSPQIFGAPPMFTGVQRIHLLGWSQDAQVTITQNEPYPWQILYIALEIKT